MTLFISVISEYSVGTISGFRMNPRLSLLLPCLIAFAGAAATTAAANPLFVPGPDVHSDVGDQCFSEAFRMIKHPPIID